MATTSVLKKLFGVNNIKIKNVHEEFAGSEETVIIDAEDYKRDQCRCPICGKKVPKYDTGKSERLWRVLDAGSAKVYVRAKVQRVRCPEHGIHTQSVSWARHGSRFARCFEDLVAWLSLHLPKKAVAEFARISWNTVGPIISRVVDELSARSTGRLDNLVRIGIDETSYKKGHKYLTVVINHDTGEVVWVHEGHSEETLSKFFESLTEKQRASIRIVTADGARWIANCIRKYCPGAKRCIDPFHVVAWAQELLDKLKNKLAAEAKRAISSYKASKGKGRTGAGEPRAAEAAETYKALKGARYALLKNPENLTENQKARLDMVLLLNPKLARAYRLKEELRLIFKLPPEEVPEAIYRWRHRAWTSKIPEFVDFHKKIKRHEAAILETIKNDISNARIEAVNNKIKLSIRMAYGFRNIENLYSAIMLRCGGFDIKLPGRIA